MRFTLSKAERLKSIKTIRTLFQSPKGNLVSYPIRISWQFTEPTNPFPAQVVFSVSKRQYKKAVERNRLKRVLREAYRLNKASLHQKLIQHNIHCSMVIAYIGKEPVPIQTIEKKLVLALDQMTSDIGQQEKA